MIYTSHNMGEIKRLCNAVVLLRPRQAPVLYRDVNEGIAAYRDEAAVAQPSTPQPEASLA